MVAFFAPSAASPAAETPRFEAVLARVTASLDGRPLPVNRAQVVALVRYWGDQQVFRRVHGPEALDAGLQGAARLELEEHYRFGRRALEGRMRLRVQLPGGAPPLEVEVRARVGRDAVAARSRGEARQAMLGEAQRDNLERLRAALRAEPLLFEARRRPVRDSGSEWRAAQLRGR